MKKSGSVIENKIQKVWNQKIFDVDKLTKHKAESLYFDVVNSLSTFTELNKLNLNPKRNTSFMFIKENHKSKKNRGRLTQSNSKIRERQESYLAKHFNELDTLLMNLTGGKVGLHSLGNEKKISENSEEATSHAFDLDSRFSDKVKIQLLELKRKEDRYKVKKPTKKPITQEKLKYCFSMANNYNQNNPNFRSQALAATLPGLRLRLSIPPVKQAG
jgi:hypothetical protein